MSQKNDVLNYIKTHGSITNRDAARDLECYRLSARVLDLRDDLIPIVTTMETNPETGSRYARYTLG